MIEEQKFNIIGAIKIKDGLFIGDEYAAQDLEFVITNKVTHVINCSGQNMPNVWEQIGVMYLTFPWTQSDLQVLFDEEDQILNEIVKFIDEAADAGESTLVHSMKGQSRACCVLAAYFMKKYNWALLKTLEFLNSRRPELEIRSSFFQQLTNLSQKLQMTRTGAMIQDWQEVQYNQNGSVHVEELIIRNTFLNSRNAPVADIFQDQQLQNQMLKKQKFDRLTWNDIHHNRDLSFHFFPTPDNFNPIKHYKTSSQNKTIIKSCLKGSNKHFRSGSEGVMIQQNQQQQQQNIGMGGRSMSGKQIGMIGQSLKQNMSAKNILEENPQQQNQGLSGINNLASKNTDFHMNNQMSNNFYTNNQPIQNHQSNQIQFSLNQRELSENNMQGKQTQHFMQEPSYQLKYQQNSEIQPVQQNNYLNQQQPQLTQQIREMANFVPSGNPLTQYNNLLGKSEQQYTQNIPLSQLQLQQQHQQNQLQQHQQQQQQMGLSNNISQLSNNQYQNSVSINLNQPKQNSLINQQQPINSINRFNSNNNENNSNLLNIPNSAMINTQYGKNQNDIGLNGLASQSQSSKNCMSFQNALALNSANLNGVQSVSTSALTSPYNNQKNTTSIYNQALNDRKQPPLNNKPVTSASKNSNSKPMMPPQSVQMLEKKQNLISKILEQQSEVTTPSSFTPSSTIVRSNSLKILENNSSNDRNTPMTNQNNTSTKNSISNRLNPSSTTANNINNSSLNSKNQNIFTGSNTNLLQKNNISNQTFNKESTNSLQNNLSLNQPISSQLQSGYRSNSLPKKLDEKRSPSNKLTASNTNNTNRPSSLSTKEKQENLLQQQKNQFSYLNNEMKNSQTIQDNSRLQSNQRNSSIHEQSNGSITIDTAKPVDNLYYGSQTLYKQNLSNLLQANKSPVNNNSVKGYIKNERPPLKPREQNSSSIISTTNNTNSSVNTSLSKSFQSSILTKNTTLNSNLQSQQTSTSDSNRYSNSQFNSQQNGINSFSTTGSSKDLKQIPTSSSLTTAISNKISNTSTIPKNSSLITATDKYNNIPSTTNKSPISSAGSTLKSTLLSKPPQQKPLDKSIKENQSSKPYTVYQPMMNNFIDSQKSKDNLNTQSSNSQFNKQPASSQYRQYSPDIQNLQNKLDKQIGASKNRIRSSSPAQPLSKLKSFY